MAEFTLDTSGAVARPPTEDGFADGWLYWPDLSPFEQGCVEAVLESLSCRKCQKWNASNLRERLQDHGSGGRFKCDACPGFSDLAPETLEAIRKDCAAAIKIMNGFLPHYRKTAAGGRAFWEDRQSDIMHGFPPLTPDVSDDGKVRLRAAAEHKEP